MNTQLPTRPHLDERIQLALTAGEKRRVFEVAAARGVTVSELLRGAIAQVSVDKAGVARS